MRAIIMTKCLYAIRLACYFSTLGLARLLCFLFFATRHRNIIVFIFVTYLNNAVADERANAALLTEAAHCS